MSGGLHILDMIKRHKENEALRKNINYFKTRKYYRHASRSIGVSYKTATEPERELIRLQVIRQRKQDSVKSMIALGLSLLIAGMLLFLLIKSMR